MNGMRIKNKKAPSRKKAFSLLELMVALALFSVVFLSVFSMLSNLHITQKKIQVANDFYDESRILMDRLVQLSRNNTIDYDRYYCRTQDPDLSDSDCQCLYMNTTDSDCANSEDELEERLYEYAFLQDIGSKKRNLGGMDPEWNNGDEDTNAFDGNAQTELYLINADRTVRTAIRVSNQKVETQTYLGIDRNGDKTVDEWGLAVWNDGSDNRCEVTGVSVEGDFTDPAFCAQAHDWTSITPSSLNVTQSSFFVSPNKDPYLAFADDDVQIQPFVRFFLTFQRDNSQGLRFPDDNIPEISFQTTASSRVLGSPR